MLSENIEMASLPDKQLPVTPSLRRWSSQLKSILSCLNYSVGLGNVWRFPVLAYRNGGGAFLLLFLIMQIIVGIPIFFMELVIGQFSGLGPVKAFNRMAPVFHGLGYCTTIIGGLIAVYYQLLIAWAIFYLAASFNTQLGWGSCDNSFNSADCFTQIENAECLNKSLNETWSLLYINHTCRSVEEICEMNGQYLFNKTHCYKTENDTTNYNFIKKMITRTLASEEYYRDQILGIDGATWSSWGSLRWQIVMCLLLSWFLIYLCLRKDVQMSGKVVYFTAIFPVFILVFMLITVLQQENSKVGIMFYIIPKWEGLFDVTVWGDAASQTFYSLGLGCSSLVTLASYNRFNNNCFRDMLIVSTVNNIVAIMVGFVVFGTLGILATEMDVSVEKLVINGPGLAFITYSEALLHMPFSQFFSVAFFLMFIIIGVGSQLAGVLAINTTITEKWSCLQSHKHHVTAAICGICFLLALPMCCSSGVYLFTFLDYSVASWPILLTGLAEVSLVGWTYGCFNFLENIDEMGMKLNKYISALLTIMWKVLTPGFLISIVIFTIYNLPPLHYADYIFPSWVNTLSWFIGVITLVPMPAFALYQVIKGFEEGYDLVKPTALWGPQSAASISSLAASNDSSNDEKHCKAYENFYAGDSFGNAPSESGMIESNFHNRIATDNAYENVAFHFENLSEKTS